MPRLRSCRTKSFVCGPHTLCGLTMTVLPSSIYGLNRSSQSAPEPANPSRVSASCVGRSYGLELAESRAARQTSSRVGRVEIVRRDEHMISAKLRGLEDSLHVFDGPVGRDASADRCPVRPLLARHVVLRFDKDDRRIALLDVDRIVRDIRPRGDGHWKPLLARPPPTRHRSRPHAEMQSDYRGRV